MNKLENFALDHGTAVIVIVGFFPIFAVFTPLILVEEFWQYLSFVYILFLTLIPVRGSLLIKGTERKIQEFLSLHKGGEGLPDDLDGRYKELTNLSNELDYAKELYSRKLSSALNSSVIMGLVWTLFSAFYNF
jgi:hypothetical protein